MCLRHTVFKTSAEENNMRSLRVLLFSRGCIIILSSLPIVFATTGNNKIYCDQLLNEENLSVKASSSNHQYEEHGYFYDVVLKKNLPTEFCDMDREHGIRFSFDRITRISDILIEKLPFVKNPNAIEILIWRGATSVQCPFVREVYRFRHTEHYHYECGASATGGYNPAGCFVNTIEIKSATPLTLDVMVLKKKQALGWLVPIQMSNEHDTEYPERCPPPGLYPGQTMEPAEAFYQLQSIVTIQCVEDRFTPSGNAQRTCGSDGTWSPSKEKSVCEPEMKWQLSKPSSINRNVSEGMRNVSHVFHFNNDLFRISKFKMELTQQLEEDQAKRALSFNVVYHVLNSTSVIYEHMVGFLYWYTPGEITSTLTKAIDYCANCSVRVTFLEYHWNDWIVKNKFYVIASSSSFENATRHLGFSPKDECPPIDPYRGMPESYTDYQLILNGSINELLRQTPCRPGYAFLGDAQLVKQCKSGHWIGKGFPVCELIRTKTPPKVDDATWDYVHHDVFHEIKYICINGLYLNGNGQVLYNVERDAWIGVPNGCRAAGVLFLETNWPYICIAIIAVIIALLAVVILRRYRSGTRTAATFRGHAIGETTERFETRVWTRPNYDPGRQECDVPAIPRPEPREQFHDYAVIYGDLSSVHSYQDVSSVHTYHDVSHAHYRN